MEVKIVAPATALVVGVTGIAGRNIAESLLASGWKVLGLSRTPRNTVPGVEHIYADVLDVAALEAALSGHEPTHLFYATWLRGETEAENCAVNGAMLSNTLEVLGRQTTLKHAVLITGLKHYLGPFEAYGSDAYSTSTIETPFREDMPRVPYANFYYDQEDILFAEAERQGFTWSVLRPHTLIGWALGNAMNMGVTLAVYGSLCAATGEPFVFPGTTEQLNGVTDVTDARLLGRHAVWTATEPRAANQAFNSVNGDVFRWRQLWPQLAAALGATVGEHPGHPVPLQGRMESFEPVWSELVAKHDLLPNKTTDLVSWWHTDADLGRQVETFADMSKSRELGFLDYQPTVLSFLDLFERLRQERVIPPLG